MRYEIMGGNLPAVEIHLDAGEQIRCEGGAMSWMSSNMEMETQGGGIGKIFSKAISGEKLFQNIYTAKGSEGCIGIASSFPGNIIAVEIGPGREVICQKSAFLASSMGVELSVFFQKKLGAGFVGGEGFIMQKLSGSGIAFLELDGSVIEKTLAPGEQMILDTGHLAMMEGSCSMDVESIKGVKNVLLGGEGMFHTVITGPGKIAIQTMPAYQMANAIIPYIPTSNS